MQSLYTILTQIYYSILSCFTQEELNVVVLGFPNSGKSTLVNLITGDEFRSDMIPTIGVEYKYHKMNNLIMKIFDVSGQERFQNTLWTEYYGKDADLIIYVVDLSDTLTLKQARSKLIEIMLNTSDKNTPIVIVGNKTDLLNDSDFIAIAEDNTETTTNDKNANSSSSTPQINRTDAFMSFLGLKQETTDKMTLKRQIPDANLNQDKDKSNKTIIEHKEEEFLEFYRDIAVFLISCKEDEQIDDLITWVIGR